MGDPEGVVDVGGSGLPPCGMCRSAVIVFSVACASIACMCVTCVSGAQGGQQRASDLWNWVTLEL